MIVLGWLLNSLKFYQGMIKEKLWEESSEVANGHQAGSVPGSTVAVMMCVFALGLALTWMSVMILSIPSLSVFICTWSDGASLPLRSWIELQENTLVVERDASDCTPSPLHHLLICNCSWLAFVAPLRTKFSTVVSVSTPPLGTIYWTTV